MAEFCEECFVHSILEYKERKSYESGNIRLEISKDAEMCEGCGKRKPIVISVEKNKSNA